MVIERNWLDVYPYTNWGGNCNLPTFEVGQRFVPTELLLKEVYASAVPSSFLKQFSFPLRNQCL